MGSMADAMLACRRCLILIAAIKNELATGDTVQRERLAKLSKVLADAFGKPGVVVPYDDAVGSQDLEGGLGIGFDALVGVTTVDEAEVDVVEFGRRFEGERVAAKLVNASCGGVALKCEASRGAGEANPLLVAFGESLYLGLSVFLGQVEGEDLSLGCVEREGDGADATKRSGLEDLFGTERAGDGGQQGVRDGKAEAGEADRIDGRKHNFVGLIAAEE